MESSQGPGFAIEGGGDFWIGEGEPPAAPVHVAFAAADRATVDKFHRAAVEAGGRDNGAPAFARSTTPGITQRSSLTRTGTTSKRSSTETASCQPRDARLPRVCGKCLLNQRQPAGTSRQPELAAFPLGPQERVFDIAVLIAFDRVRPGLRERPDVPQPSLLHHAARGHVNHHRRRIYALDAQLDEALLDQGA